MSGKWEAFKRKIVRIQSQHVSVSVKGKAGMSQKQWITRAEKLYLVLRSLQLVIDDNEHLAINDNKHLAKIIPTPPLPAFKQPTNLKQMIAHSKLPSLPDNIDHNTTQPCYGDLCKTSRIIDMYATVTHGNTTYHVHGRYSCDLANVVYLIRSGKNAP
eukprot:g42852.t1